MPYQHNKKQDRKPTKRTDRPASRKAKQNVARNTMRNEATHERAARERAANSDTQKPTSITREFMSSARESSSSELPQTRTVLARSSAYSFSKNHIAQPRANARFAAPHNTKRALPEAIHQRKHAHEMPSSTTLFKKRTTSSPSRSGSLLHSSLLSQSHSRQFLHLLFLAECG